MDIGELKRQMKEGKSNILVTVRVRPLSTNELLISGHETMTVTESKIVSLKDPQFEMSPNDVSSRLTEVLRENHNRSKQYGFDFVFDKQASQGLVFANTTQFLVDGLLRGFNATIFAYGATGAGKTFTMMGSAKQPGVIPQTLDYLFELVARMPNDSVDIRVSYVEVYNEVIRDLLTSEDLALEIREDPDRGIIISNVLELPATSQDQIMRMFRWRFFIQAWQQEQN